MKADTTQKDLSDCSGSSGRRTGSSPNQQGPEKAIALDPSCEPAWFHAGNSLFALRRFEEARTAYCRAPGIYPNDSYAWTDRADRLMKLGRVAEARKASDMAALVAVKKLNIRRCENELERIQRERGTG